MSAPAQPERRALRPSLSAGNLEHAVISTVEHELQELDEEIKRTERLLQYQRDLVVLKRELLDAAKAIAERSAEYRKSVDTLSTGKEASDA